MSGKVPASCGNPTTAAPGSCDTSRPSWRSSTSISPSCRRKQKRFAARCGSFCASTWAPAAQRRARSWGGFNRKFSRTMGARGWIGSHERTLPRALRRAGGDARRRRAGGRHWIADRQSGPLLLRFGTEAQRERFLPAITRGELAFAIGMSEPDSGSDLASIRTRAVRADGGYVVNGTKVWTSNAHRSDYLDRSGSYCNRGLSLGLEERDGRSVSGAFCYRRVGSRRSRVRGVCPALARATVSLTAASFFARSSDVRFARRSSVRFARYSVNSSRVNGLSERGPFVRAMLSEDGIRLLGRQRQISWEVRASSGLVPKSCASPFRGLLTINAVCAGSRETLPIDRVEITSAVELAPVPAESDRHFPALV